MQKITSSYIGRRKLTVNGSYKYSVVQQFICIFDLVVCDGKIIGEVNPIAYS
jgi:hypothetical protein